MASSTQETTVNLGSYEIFNFKVRETLPPNSPFASLLNKTGVQTTPQLARGFVTGSSIDLLNGNLTHVCDFKFIFNFDILSNIGLISPVAALQKAIKNAKLKAANRLRSLLQDSIKAFRAVVDGILSALGFDPSGAISLSWSLGKDIIRKINDIIEYIAEKAEIILEWIFFAKMIQELLQWIASLPEKIKQLLVNCFNNFTNSLKQLASNVQSIPSQITNLTTTQINTLVTELNSASNATLNTLQSQQTSNVVPAVIQDAFNSPNNTHAAAITQYIASTTPSQEEIDKQKQPSVSSKNSP